LCLNVAHGQRLLSGKCRKFAEHPRGENPAANRGAAWCPVIFLLFTGRVVLHTRLV
jgi:hypothetical protein